MNEADYVSEFKALSEEIKQEIFTEYHSKASNKKFKYNTPLCRKEWYYINLYNRIKQNVYKIYNHKIFNKVIKAIDNLMLKTVENSIQNFADVRTLNIGDIV